MKKLITFIITLLAIVAGAKADNRTQISLVEATSNIATIPMEGNYVTEMPSFNVTAGSPAYFYLDDPNVCWSKLVNDQWEDVLSGTFTPGTWYFFCYVCVEGSYKLADDVKIKVNGVEWERSEVINDGDDFSYVMVASPDFVIAPPRTEISLIEGTSPDLTTIPKVGVSVKTLPTITVTKGAPAFFCIDNSNANWQKMVDGEWQDVYNGTFTPGTWRFDCQVRIDPSTDPNNQYVLASNVKVKVNGEECQTGYYEIGEVYSLIRVYSPEIIVEGSADTRTQVSLVEATMPDLSSVAVVDADVTMPALTITSGQPAYQDEYESLWSSNNNYSWVTSGRFTPGVWNYLVRIKISGNGAKTHVLSDNVRLVVNGVEWNPYTGTAIDGEASYREFLSPDITVSDVREGQLGTQGTWRFENGVLTVDYIGAMPISTKTDTNPETAFRLKWIDFLSEIKEVVVTGVDVEIQPYFLYYEGDGPSGSHPDDHIKKVTLSSGVKSIGRQALAIYDLKQLCCYGMTPPELASSNSSSIHCFWKARVEANKAFLVLLPGASVNYAIANTEWMIFANVGGGFLSNLHPEDDPVGIVSPLGEMKEGAAIYNVSGQRLNKMQKGINIKDGQKVLVK